MMDENICQNETYFTNSDKRKNKSEKCTKKAFCIIRKNNKEYRACKQHKNAGIFVRLL
jgi:hypothetical protein